MSAPIAIPGPLRSTIDEIRAIDARLGGYSKQCLVYALSAIILTRADVYAQVEGGRQAVIEREFEKIDLHKKGARAEVSHRRLIARMDRALKPQPKRRRRRQRKKTWNQS